MKTEHDQALCAAFPLLYRDRNRSPRETPMSFGFGVGDGWYNLIWRLSEKLEPLIAAQPEAERAVAAQVKEKFGTLRFYLDSSTDEMEKLIDVAEDESAKTCEECGASGILRSGGWLRTLCDGCAKGRPVYEAAV